MHEWWRRQRLAQDRAAAFHGVGSTGRNARKKRLRSRANDSKAGKAAPGAFQRDEVAEAAGEGRKYCLVGMKIGVGLRFTGVNQQGEEIYEREEGRIEKYWEIRDEDIKITGGGVYDWNSKETKWDESKDESGKGVQKTKERKGGDKGDGKGKGVEKDKRKKKLSDKAVEEVSSLIDQAAQVADEAVEVAGEDAEDRSLNKAM